LQDFTLDTKHTLKELRDPLYRTAAAVGSVASEVSVKAKAAQIRARALLLILGGELSYDRPSGRSTMAVASNNVRPTAFCIQVFSSADPETAVAIGTIYRCISDQWSLNMKPEDFVIQDTSFKAYGDPNNGGALLDLSFGGDETADDAASPAVPTDGAAVADGDVVTLTWEPDDGADSYRVYRSLVTGGPYAWVGSTADTEFVDMTAGGDVFYVVTGVRGAFESAFSDEFYAVGPLGVPTLSLAGASGQVTATIGTVAGATSYDLQRRTTAGPGAWSTVYTGSAGAHVDSGLTNGTGYDYQARATNISETGAWSDTRSATPLGVVTGLIASAGDSVVYCSYNPVAGADGYRIQRAVTPFSTFVSVGTVAPGSTVSWADNSTNDPGSPPVNGTAYVYRIAAYVGSTITAYSAPQSATPEPVLSAPTGVSATPGDGQVVIAWDAVGGASGYNVKRRLVSGGPYSIIFANVASSPTIDTGRTNGVVYYYVVSAIDVDVDGTNSSEVNATPGYVLPAGADLDINPAAGVTEIGGSVSAVTDQSASASSFRATNVAWNASDANFNGAPSLGFDGIADGSGSNMWAANPAFGDASATWMAVIRPTSPTYDRAYSLAAPETPSPYGGQYFDLVYVTQYASRLGRWNTTTATYPYSGDIVAGTPMLLTVTYDSASHTTKFYLNGVLKYTDTATEFSFDASVTGGYIGCRVDGQAFSGQMARLLHFDHALSDGDRTAIESEFASVYGV
jgi:fibronectin type 3 domain-containing protein